MADAPHSLRSAVIFDRDGVLNIDHGYVVDPARLDWIDGAREAILALNAAGALVFVATNQSGVGRGYFSFADLDRFHDAMQSQLADIGAHIDAFYACPFHESANLEAFRIADHPDRKPNPGMILRIMADWPVDPARTIMVGDKATDVEAARRAGIQGRLFPGGDLAAFLRVSGTTT